MRHTRARYHYAVRYVIKEETRIKSNRMAEAISEGNDRNLKKCVNCMEHGKKEENGIFSNHIIHGTEKLFKALTLLYNGMLIHGVSPSELLRGTMCHFRKIKERRIIALITIGR